ncbi:MAG: transcription antitermination factor NusB [Deltaproteobacteria bacterium]|nr:MAG: transcription antitermination factor NusB [Deltaproteobacteria bacterium]
MRGRAARVPRRRSREAALQVLYAIDVAGAREPADDAFEAAAAHFEVPEAARSFAEELVRGVVAKRDELDALVATHSAHWRVSRMAAVDRNLLRLATYELCNTDTPTAVVIDEAVQLARRFGEDRSPAFVNGILDAIARTVRPEPS